MDWETRSEQLTEQLAAARMEIAQLKAQIAGDVPTAMSWLQRKDNAQRKALARLNQRIVNQRFVLRKINELGRGLTREEWNTFRSERPAVELDESILVG